MKFTEFASLLVLAVTALADTVTYDQRYDSPSTSLDALVRTHSIMNCSPIQEPRSLCVGLLQRTPRS
ncbi:hypothetical protein R3P38DRAFT_3113707 [Favolaschia claudopus]|uniref:Uncharacterized protein n=1 Tax=Favolaschia claudopus TaxID=2862362 RepID=A0AAV9ZGG7_9AGAR